MDVDCCSYHALQAGDLGKLSRSGWSVSFAAGLRCLAQPASQVRETDCNALRTTDARASTSTDTWSTPD
eukprot:3724527-Pyramimonas_sp.AAC.1